jgi:hypothetical protein
LILSPLTQSQLQLLHDLRAYSLIEIPLESICTLTGSSPSLTKLRFTRLLNRIARAAQKARLKGRALCSLLRFYFALLRKRSLIDCSHSIANLRALLAAIARS